MWEAEHRGLLHRETYEFGLGPTHMPCSFTKLTSLLPWDLIPWHLWDQVQPELHLQDKPAGSSIPVLGGVWERVGVGRVGAGKLMMSANRAKWAAFCLPN